MSDLIRDIRSSVSSEAADRRAVPGARLDTNSSGHPNSVLSVSQEKKTRIRPPDLSNLDYIGDDLELREVFMASLLFSGP